VFVLLRGELQVMDLDQTTPLYSVGEGALFGEEVVLRHLQVGGRVLLGLLLGLVQRWCWCWCSAAADPGAAMPIVPSAFLGACVPPLPRGLPPHPDAHLGLPTRPPAHRPTTPDTHTRPAAAPLPGAGL
jgi:hypothetical protein